MIVSLPMSQSAKRPREAAPAHVDPIHWHQSVGYARQACARIFRDGGSPANALEAFGLDGRGETDWARAVERIAEALTASNGLKRAA